jgi:dipeptidyl aminopeptidase/acylaminoacyl peptidase
VEEFDGPFGDLQEYLDIPRVSGLALSPDGGTLLASVQRLSGDRKKFVSALWRIDPGGGGPVRLTRSAKGESAPRLLPDGSLLFLSDRPDQDAKKPGGGPDEAAADGPGLWLLPPHGEARLLAAPPGGVESFAVARDTGAIVLSSSLLQGATGLESDAELRKARKDADATGVLHEDGLLRIWDRETGPAAPRLLAAPAPAGDGRLELKDLTGHVGLALETYGSGPFDISPDGRTVVTSWKTEHPNGLQAFGISAIDVATGERRPLVEDETADFGDPHISPDGSQVVCVRETHGSYDEAPRVTMWLQPLDGGPGRELIPEFDQWPVAEAWSHDSSALYFVADEQGRAPIFQLDLGSGEMTRLTGDQAAYSAVQVAPDGTVYALRSAIDAPPAPVRLRSSTPDQDPEFLHAPGGGLTLPGRLEQIVAHAADGHPIHARLMLPDGAGSGDSGSDSPAPLLVFIHGGPHMSSNSWNWRWCPWVMVRRGYAVLMPDPALSSGYGQAFHERGWGEWGSEPFTDLMAATDAAVARPEIDGTRTAALGGSFGGYMANWIVTHTDRFKAVVAHAGLWQLQLEATADIALYSDYEYGPVAVRDERRERNSPHRFAADVKTPILVIHGDKDYRVPVSNALWQWYDLKRQGADAKFLYFPDENHWILKPQNSALWYRTVLAFLAEKVLGEPWRRPDLL